MFHKKKLNFWRLAFLYTGMIATILLLLWNSPNKSNSAMMDGSMGSMMKGMHTQNITIYDLLSNPEAKQKMEEMASHHENSPVYNMGVLTTASVFLLLPIIIGGSIMLAILWIK
jgi:hypothetical protein